MTRLYHATTRARLNDIRADGLSAGSYLAGSRELADYYAGVIEDEGDDPIVVVVDMDRLVAAIGTEYFEIDRPSLMEPITTVLGMDEEAVQQAWSRSFKDWHASLSVLGSFRVGTRIPVEAIDIDSLDATSGPTV